MDEADRLLAQSFQDWLAQVLAVIRVHVDEDSPISFKHSPSHPISSGASTPHPSPQSNFFPFDSASPDGLAPPHLQSSPSPWSIPRSFFLERETSCCQKLLFSATLTRDPGKIAALELRDPKYFIIKGAGEDAAKGVGVGVLDVVTDKFSMPSTLSVSFPRSFFLPIHILNLFFVPPFSLRLSIPAALKGAHARHLIFPQTARVFPSCPCA